MLEDEPVCFAPVLACEEAVPPPLVAFALVLVLVLVLALDEFEADVDPFDAWPPFAALAPFDADCCGAPVFCAPFEDDALALDCADCAACCWAFTLCWSVCENGVAACVFEPEPLLPGETPGVPERDPRMEMGDMAMPFV